MQQRFNDHDVASVKVTPDLKHVLRLMCQLVLQPEKRFSDKPMHEDLEKMTGRHYVNNGDIIRASDLHWTEAHINMFYFRQMCLKNGAIAAAGTPSKYLRMLFRNHKRIVKGQYFIEMDWLLALVNTLDEELARELYQRLSEARSTHKHNQQVDHETFPPANAVVTNKIVTEDGRVESGDGPITTLNIKSGSRMTQQLDGSSNGKSTPVRRGSRRSNRRRTSKYDDLMDEESSDAEYVPPSRARSERSAAARATQALADDDTLAMGNLGTLNNLNLNFNSVAKLELPSESTMTLDEGEHSDNDTVPDDYMSTASGDSGSGHKRSRDVMMEDVLVDTTPVAHVFKKQAVANAAELPSSTPLYDVLNSLHFEPSHKNIDQVWGTGSSSSSVAATAGATAGAGAETPELKPQWQPLASEASEVTEALKLPTVGHAAKLGGSGSSSGSSFALSALPSMTSVGDEYGQMDQLFSLDMDTYTFGNDDTMMVYNDLEEVV